MSDKPQIYAAIPIEQLKKMSSGQLRDDICKRLKRAALNDFVHGVPVEFDFVAASDKIDRLDSKMKDMYKSGFYKEDCALVKINIEISLEIQNDR